MSILEVFAASFAAVLGWVVGGFMGRLHALRPPVGSGQTRRKRVARPGAAHSRAA